MLVRLREYEADADHVCMSSVLCSGASLVTKRPWGMIFIGPHSDALGCIMRIHLHLAQQCALLCNSTKYHLTDWPKRCDMQCACTLAVDKVLAYCLAGSRQETSGQVIYIFFYRSEHKPAFEQIFCIHGHMYSQQLHAKQEADVFGCDCGSSKKQARNTS